MKKPKVVTLANLADCSEQEIFDHVCYGLKAQEFQRSGNFSDSEDYNEADELGCMYRHKDRKCAAGLCISAEEYKRLLDDGEIVEGTAWDTLVENGAVPEEHKALMLDLQDAHDGGETAEQMIDALEDVGTRRGLDLSLLHQLAT